MVAVHDDIEESKSALTATLLGLGFLDVTVITDKLRWDGHAVFRATRDGRYVAIRSYRVPGRNHEKTIAEMLRLSSLHHPNIIRPLFIMRTGGLLSVITEYAGGGSLLRLVSMCHLEYRVVRFIFQQLVLATRFCHAHGIYLRNVDPASLLVAGAPHGWPIVKIFDFRRAKDLHREGAVRTPQDVTLYTCPHALRKPNPRFWHCEEYAPVCDVWALAVLLHFLCFRTWPFSVDQIQRWAADPPEQWPAWNADAHLFSGLDPEAVPEGARRFMQDVFAGGRLSTEQYAARCPSLDDLMRQAWFREGMPEGVGHTATYDDATRSLRESQPFKELEEEFAAAQAPFHHGRAPAEVQDYFRAAFDLGGSTSDSSDDSIMSS